MVTYYRNREGLWRPDRRARGASVGTERRQAEAVLTTDRQYGFLVQSLRQRERVAEDLATQARRVRHLIVVQARKQGAHQDGSPPDRAQGTPTRRN